MIQQCQNVLQTAKKINKNKNPNKHHQGTKPDAETSPSSSDFNPNLILGPE